MNSKKFESEKERERNREKQMDNHQFIDMNERCDVNFNEKLDKLNRKSCALLNIFFFSHRFGVLLLLISIQ